ncbi:MAG: argininosuccinate lyase [Methanobrevibacter sp.]|nr:argininosuccinate lyase [Candidatus Methanovirga aequatorialis]
MKIRDGRLKKSMDEETAEFTSSLNFDKYIFESDVKCNVAHTLMLKEEKIITEEVADKILEALFKLMEDGYDALNFNHADEDIHMAVENYVTKTVGGDVAGFMHTAKSRNDQVATDLRLSLRVKVNEIQITILDFIKGLVELAIEHKTTTFVGYTHLQHGQPVTFGHHLMAYAHSLKRDYQRLKDSYKRINLNPLGSGALATTTFPINRELTTKLLGFDDYLENSMDGVSSRDFIIETVSNLAILTSNLCKIAEELILWSSYEFGLIEIADEFSSTSSIMPQKKNPDVAELVRGKSSIITGELMTMLMILKGIPYTYNRDLQEINPHLWNVIENTEAILTITSKMTLSINFKKERALELVYKNFATATDLADLIVKEKMIPFRTSHQIVGRIVNEVNSNDLDFNSIDSEFVDKIAVEIIGKQLSLSNDLIKKALDPIENVKSRNVPGGPSPEMVDLAAKNMQKFLEKEYKNKT